MTDGGRVILLCGKTVLLDTAKGDQGESTWI